ncbi:tRNA (guanosine(46)-N7)-methyltransferase TrmB [Aureibacillus halotolerans]|uniref:tRNA (guanine-N(7)-)-methyltransferase n=1 Tax=Aureibacillus halotolerans TaxID=1508390 RepID=A0A4R6U086_9BACI|nr:tRNA (guanosine(46)-N7)-methyltransferase TrmB [Aureibacillus halotolerans]TDQ39066.1 tRNA (guanine-N(7)-)-methyltransferase [Aureibacillus halotolerans]
MRMKHKPWAESYLQSHPSIAIQEPELRKGKWLQAAGKTKLHIEIGSGKGQFITQLAAQHPDWLFIAVEKHESVVVSVLQKCIEQGLNNLCILNVDAERLTECFADNEVDVFYLNFSDPWPKKRHMKRRLSHAGFLNHYAQMLTNEGQLQMKTDNQGLFIFSLESFSQNGWGMEAISFDLHHQIEMDPTIENIETEYEEKFSAKGQPIYTLTAKPLSNRTETVE